MKSAALTALKREAIARQQHAEVNARRACYGGVPLTFPEFLDGRARSGEYHAKKGVDNAASALAYAARHRAILGAIIGRVRQRPAVRCRPRYTRAAMVARAPRRRTTVVASSSTQSASSGDSDGGSDPPGRAGLVDEGIALALLQDLEVAVLDRDHWRARALEAEAERDRRCPPRDYVGEAMAAIGRAHP